MIISPDEAKIAIVKAKEFLGVIIDHLAEKQGQKKLL